MDKDEPSSPPDLCVEDDLDLLGSEQKQAGRLAWGVYRTYWTAVGGLLAASILMSLLLMQGVDQHFIFPTFTEVQERINYSSFKVYVSGAGETCL